MLSWQQKHCRSSVHMPTYLTGYIWAGTIFLLHVHVIKQHTIVPSTQVMHVVACFDILACLASKQSLQPYAWVETVQQFMIMYHTILSQPLAAFMHTLLRLASDSFEDWKLYPLILEANCIVPEAVRRLFVYLLSSSQKLFWSQSACSQNRLVHRLKCGRCLLCQC